MGARDEGSELAVATYVRKTVTIVFSDVVGSTALGERLDPEALHDVIRRYGAEMARVVELHGGRVEKFIGDAVMAVFGVPVLHEDDALRAVRAALEMRTALVALNVHLEREYGVELAMRIGVHTGEVITAEHAVDQGLIAGDAVNAASRLQSAAPPGAVLLGTRDAPAGRRGGAPAPPRRSRAARQDRAHAHVAGRRARPAAGAAAGAGGGRDGRPPPRAREPAPPL